MVEFINVVELVSGGTGAATGAFCGFPLDTVKVRLQCQSSSDKTGALRVFKNIIAKEGPQGLFKGWKSPVFGQFLFNAIVFSVEGQANRFLTENSKHMRENELIRSASSDRHGRRRSTVLRLRTNRARKNPLSSLWRWIESFQVRDGRCPRNLQKTRNTRILKGAWINTGARDSFIWRVLLGIQHLLHSFNYALL